MGSCSLDRKLVLPDRIELSTSPLPMECSTTELRQHARYPGNRPKRPPTRRPVLATRAPLAQARGQAGKGSKSSKILGLLSTGCFNAVKPQGNPKDLPTPARFPTTRGGHSQCPNHRLRRPCGVVGHCGGRRRNPLCSCDGGCGRCGAGFNQDVFDGTAMKGNQDSANEKTVGDVKDSRRDRLKLALRENLKRRKSRGRGEASASSETDDASLDTASRKP